MTERRTTSVQEITVFEIYRYRSHLRLAGRDGLYSSASSGSKGESGRSGLKRYFSVILTSRLLFWISPRFLETAEYNMKSGPTSSAERKSSEAVTVILIHVS